MFNKILIANRGAIACRIIRTLNKMNVASVAIYSEADLDSLHVALADEAYSLGEGGAAQTYLDQGKIFAIAQQTGADAIHPGYGFLSENPGFVESCAEQSISFIGPSPENMRAFSLKHKARTLAAHFNVPLIPGTELLADKQSAISAAKDMAFPVILKSTAGGGGIGMQVCRSIAELEEVFDSVVRLSENNFSDGGVFIEKYIENARHIEVQIFGDGKGVAIALGERDCSLQRRNQKVIEETPAPNLPEHTRRELHATAISLAAGVRYENAGTVEFIYDADRDAFYFLEVNTRLQVEHGITEEIFSVDLVQWMLEQAYAPITNLQERREKLTAKGHAVQARIYAENPANNFQPSAGLLSHVNWPEEPSNADAHLRIDTWISAGISVPALFDPMLAKMIVWAPTRTEALAALQKSLADTLVYGIETNIHYAEKLLTDDVFVNATMTTRYLNSWPYRCSKFEVLRPGTMTSIQDLPGRVGYWEVGIPPSGPFDSLSFELGNQLLNNKECAAGLEITLQGPSLKFTSATQVVITGAEVSISLDGEAQEQWSVITINPGQTLSIGKVIDVGTRAYLLIKGGLLCPDYLGSKSTFTLGQFGGHAGRALRTGDIIYYSAATLDKLKGNYITVEKRPQFSHTWKLHVVYGPHGAPDFFTEKDIDTFFSSQWEVHYNSSRTGVRLIGPKPDWARETGGEAGMHPSNIHDNAYAFGTIDFTGDMPVILGPDGPSLGGFVCPATVIHADLWKLGQLKAGDKVKFISVSLEQARDARQLRRQCKVLSHIDKVPPESCILRSLTLADGLKVTIRPAGDEFLLVEFGEQTLDLRLRFRVHVLRDLLDKYVADAQLPQGSLIDLTPGIRSLQIHYDSLKVDYQQLLYSIAALCHTLGNLDDVKVPSRTVHLPLSWDDSACHLAVQKYMQSVREDAPWCPDNIEFIRRINGLDSVEHVKDIVFNADYVVMGLGDVYLGAPVATPLDPRHRLVTTKYNPARTWTEENCVGIGGAYLCVYGMEGPGGYQFVGRTLQMWNRYQKTQSFERPWLLRFFDRLKFYPVSHDELDKIRQDFPRGRFNPTIESGEFSLREYEAFLSEQEEGITQFQTARQGAFDEELARWQANGQLHFDASHQQSNDYSDDAIPEGMTAVESGIAGSVWQLQVKQGQDVVEGEVMLILESMKMEIEVNAPCTGKVDKVFRQAGDQVAAGQVLLYIEEV